MVYKMQSVDKPVNDFVNQMGNACHSRLFSGFSPFSATKKPARTRFTRPGGLRVFSKVPRDLSVFVSRFQNLDHPGNTALIAGGQDQIRDLPHLRVAVGGGEGLG